MKTDTSHKILRYVKEKKQATAHELVDFLNISPQAVFKQLKKLVIKGKLVKIGKPPKVFYLLPHDAQEWVKEWVGYTSTATLSEVQIKILEKRYMYVSPFGEIQKGVDGFMHWCAKTKQPIEKTADEYIATLKKYDAFRKNGLIDGMQKFQSTFDQIYLDYIFYLDFYSIERFGKTKLGQMLLYAKQSQNKVLMKQLADEANPAIHKLIARYDIDAVGFIPPTVKREIQLIVEFAKQLRLSLPFISIIKVISDIAVPQKTLSKLDERIENAQRTIVVTEKKQYNNILLIDDAVGSGSTLNETAKKLKMQKICRGIIVGLAITGSFKGFDVISEV